LTGTPEHPDFGGSGSPFEYAVQMRRFDPEDGFDHLLERGELLPEHAEALGEALAELHEVADVAPAGSNWGSPPEVIGPMRDNFTDLRKLLQGSQRWTVLDRLEEWTEERFERLSGLVAQRLEQGFVRECHGDVHLGNVTLVEGRATLFDCIEFSPELRWTDVMADLAFIVMDLQEHDAHVLSWVLIDRYLARTGDYDGLALLDFYVVYRAMVRAKVAALGLGRDSEANRSILATVDRYLHFADGVIRARPTALVLTCEVSGSGKSYLARKLLARCGLIRLRSDVERKRLAGLAEFERSDASLDAGLYNAASTRETYQRLQNLAGTVLGAGLPVLVDATFLSVEQRSGFEQLAQEHGVPFGVMVCSAPETVLRERIVHRAACSDDPSEADLEVLEHQLTRLSMPDSHEGNARIIDTSAPNAVAEAEEWLGSLLSRG
jgi:aminoglycoside phosphotransferase family enzyme/predicted kinase